jgi:hypothetical protein
VSRFKYRRIYTLASYREVVMGPVEWEEGEVTVSEKIGKR